jgi:hypothetical protein
VVLSDLENVTSPADRVAGYVAGKPGGTVGAALAPYPASRDPDPPAGQLGGSNGVGHRRHALDALNRDISQDGA